MRKVILRQSRLLATGMVVAIAVCTMAVVARAQDVRPTTIPVLFSVSGAASMGTYQSGATWAIVRFLRLANADSALRPARRRNVRYRMGALSGTSAGNINALISALEWCRAAPIRPENTLYAALWLRVGLGQLNPMNTTGDTGTMAGIAGAGLISRGFFTTLWNTITTAMSQRIWDPDCNIPVGVTMTRILPAMYPLQKTTGDDPLTASTQRFVARWRAVSDSATIVDGLAMMALRPPEMPPDPRAFGAEYLIDIGADATGRDTVDRRVVFDAVQASASVPLLWAAVPLPTPVDSNFALRAQRKATGGGTPGKKPTGSALFVDGGVFDADPLGLALDLWGQERHGAVERESHPLLIRVDQDDLRGLLQNKEAVEAAAAGPAREPPAAGIEPVLTLLGGFFQSARDYELQSLGRELARDAGDPGTPVIVHTTRAYPAAAEHFHELSGFLGRPFRDHDFYLGIYDGLRFAAQQLICSDPTERDAKAPSAACVDSALTHIVIPAVERALPDPAPIPLVREFARCEAGGWSDKACTFVADTAHATPVTRADNRVVAALARANEKLLSFSPTVDSSLARRCGPRACDSVVASLLWGDGFAGILQSLDADPDYRSALAELQRLTKPDCWSAAATWGSSDAACPADRFFAQFVSDPETVLDYAFRWELRRLTEIEARQAHPSGFAQRVAALSELAYTAQAFPYRTSFFAPTSVPAMEPSHLGWNLLPYYASGAIAGGRGFEGGWNFTLRYWRDAHLGLTTPLSYWSRPRSGSRSASQWLGAGLGLYFRPPPGLKWLALEVAVQHPQRLTGPRATLRAPSTEVAWRPPLLSNLRLGYRSDGAFSVGLADLPGLLYWAWRIF